MRPFRESFAFSAILHLLFPGLGYLFWKEYAFGIFVFLIMLLASVLFFVSFLVSVPWHLKLVLMSLPLVFYLFSFFDLAKAVGMRRAKLRRSGRAAMVFLLLALVYQFLAPSAPGNFVIRNLPDVYVMNHNRLGPLFRRGEVLTANRLAYSANLVFFNYPVYHSLPAYFDVVRFADRDDRKYTGLVVGLPGDRIEMSGGTLIVNGRPEYHQFGNAFGLAGDWPLTAAQDNSILVATVNLGTIDSVHQVSLLALIGKVDRLFR
ncbi:MAG TPA: S26 family signal peptidase [Acidobacteriota bacterium]|nr:S26 family signal peptidase [Acidobacteriota bacterium]